MATATPELLESVLKILRLSENPRDFRVLAPGLEREIHWWLLTGPLGGSVRPIGVADSRICLVGRATRWITERFDQVIRIDDVAAVGYSVGYDSPSRFSREDRRLFGLPPGEDARRLLEDRH